jgi:hypothetical protein
MRAYSLYLLAIVLSCAAIAADSVSDLPKRAIEKSQITLPGSRPFILKAKVVEITNLANADYQAEIEEYWVAPDKWRRIVKTNKFSQTLVVNGQQSAEQLSGDYYPNWLRTIVAAMFDPGDVLQGVSLSNSSDNPMPGGQKVCRRFMRLSGVPPVTNQDFYSYCFDNGLLDMVVIPGYEAIYRNYKRFAGKQVARTINERIENGTDVQASVEELTELKSPDDAMFAIKEASTPLQTVRTTEGVLRGMAVNAPDIVWPTVRSGRETGTLALYVCLDRSGHVREIYELNSSNPGLSDVARDQVMKWQFNPAATNGVPVQVESVLTFAFGTTTADPIPVLDEQEGSKLILHRVEPQWPAGFARGGSPVIVTLSVHENGECGGFVFVSSDEANPTVMMSPAKISQIENPLRLALKQWRFQQYVRNGKPTEFQVRITFRIP